ncbi:MAG: glycosyltransferase, partial [Patescibacteria group bacterium]
DAGNKLKAMKVLGDDQKLRAKMLLTNNFLHSSVLYRRDSFNQVKGYDEAVNVSEDYDLFLRLGSLGKMANLEDVLAAYCISSSSESFKKRMIQFKNQLQLIKKYKKYYPGFIKAYLYNYLKLIVYGYLNLYKWRFIFSKDKKDGDNNKKKILIWESLPNISGGQRVLLNILPYLKDNFIVTVIVPSPGDFSRALNELGVVVKFINPGKYSLGKKNIIDVLKYLLLFPLSLIKSFLLINRNDLIYINSTRVLPGGILGGLIFRKPVIWHNHSLISDGKTKKVLDFLVKFSALRKMIAVSDAVSNQFSGLKDRSVVIYNGINLDKFKPKDDFEARNIVVIGDLMPTKGHDVLIRALASLGDINYKLKIVGSVRPGLESYESTLRQLVSSLKLNDRVEFLGRRNDVNIILPTMGLLVLPSTGFEACPLVVLEALACGVPVITSNLGGTLEMVNDDNIGYLFQAGDEKDLSQKLNKFFRLDNEKISAMRLNCRREAELKYSLESSARKIIQVIYETLN